MPLSSRVLTRRKQADGDKPYTDENEINCWHHDHSQGRSVKGHGMIMSQDSDK